MCMDNAPVSQEYIYIYTYIYIYIYINREREREICFICNFQRRMSRLEHR